MQGMRILAVDDMLESLEPFADLLRLQGAYVETAGSGPEALSLLVSKPYDLLISDLGMDGMDGYELIRRVREKPELDAMKAIALSGFGRQIDAERALRSGFNGHVSKPASMAEIREAVCRLSIPE